MNKDIPCLGNTAVEILDKAFQIDTAGFELKFDTVFDGEYRVGKGGYYGITWRGTIPVENGQRLSDDDMANRLAKGEVSIYVVSPGKTPYFKREYHRATGRVIKKQ